MGVIGIFSVVVRVLAGRSRSRGRNRIGRSDRSRCSGFTRASATYAERGKRRRYLCFVDEAPVKLHPQSSAARRMGFEHALDTAQRFPHGSRPPLLLDPLDLPHDVPKASGQRGPGRARRLAYLCQPDLLRIVMSTQLCRLALCSADHMRFANAVVLRQLVKQPRDTAIRFIRNCREKERKVEACVCRHKVFSSKTGLGRIMLAAVPTQVFRPRNRPADGPPRASSR